MDNSQRDAMQRLMQRQSAGPKIGRDGRVPKQFTVKNPEPAHGQTRREEKGGHPLLPNAKRPLDDLPNAKLALTKAVPVAYGQSKKA
jgi:hypothetical protein